MPSKGAILRFAILTLTLSILSTCCALLHDGVLSSILVADGRLDPVSGALVSLIVGGQACLAASLPALDIPTWASSTRKNALAIAYPTIALSTIFVVSWAMVALASSDTFYAGLRNYGLAFGSASLVRLTTKSGLYPAAGVALLFPALLPGAGVASGLMSAAFWAPNESRDIGMCVTCVVVGGAFLMMRRWNWRYF